MALPSYDESEKPWKPKVSKGSVWLLRNAEVGVDVAEEVAVLAWC